MGDEAGDPFAKHEVRELTGHKKKVRRRSACIIRGCIASLKARNMAEMPFEAHYCDRLQVNTVAWNSNGKRLASGLCRLAAVCTPVTALANCQILTSFTFITRFR